MSTIIILTIYSSQKLFATIAIIFISLLDIVLLSVIKPYRFGFVSCNNNLPKIPNWYTLRNFGKSVWSNMSKFNFDIIIH
jgi:hypothetical protein